MSASAQAYHYQVPAKYGKGGNYDVGYYGFSFYEESTIADGIAYFTRWDQGVAHKVNHVFIVRDRSTIIEADLHDGVRIDAITARLLDRRCRVFFRKPMGWTPSIGERIVAVAESQLGKGYDFAMLPAHLALGTFLGRAINKAFGGRAEEALCRLLNHDDKFFCSELGAYCLDSLPEYRDRGLLEDADETINPNELLGVGDPRVDDVLFEKWKNVTYA